MRANLPKPTPTPAISELTGEYLRAMQEISTCLMDALPAGDDLWRILGQAEAMLLEAQNQGAILRDIFGSGGVAAFCQSILDEYHTDAGEAPPIPASRDVNIREKWSPKEPRGGETYRRKRRMTAILSALTVLLISTLMLWYVGLLRYWFMGTEYYLKELHNFHETATPVESDPPSFTMPLQKASDLEHILYTDGKYTLVINEIGYNEYLKAVRDENSGKTVYERTRSWYVSVFYNVDADFRQINYIEPSAHGIATVKLADGTQYRSQISWLNSGSSGEGYEYVRLIIVDLPATLNTEGATVELDLEAPNRVRLDRISTGRR